MIYNLIHQLKTNTATVRSAADGLSDLEFELGCRIRAQIGSKSILEAMINETPNCVYIEDADDWKEFLNTQEPFQPGHNLTRRSAPVCTEKLNRGPYSRNGR